MIGYLSLSLFNIIMKIDYKKLIVAIFICLLAGFIGSFFTMDSIPTWYQGLNKPSFNPPNWLFAPVWTLLYILMGIALYFIWKRVDEKKDKTLNGLILFAGQLILNILWLIIFFGWKMVPTAFAEIILLWLSIATLIVIYWKTERKISYLLIPYIAWVSFATFLNYNIMILN